MRQEHITRVWTKVELTEAVWATLGRNAVIFIFVAFLLASLSNRNAIGLQLPRARPSSRYSQEQDRDANRPETQVQMDVRYEKRAVSILNHDNELDPWPGGIIPYVWEIDERFKEEQISLYQRNVLIAMEWWENSTCVQFHHHNVTNITLKGYYAKIIFRLDDIRCISRVGRFENRSTDCMLDKSCLGTVGSIAHELGHVIGLRHEHIRNDRNNFIRINFDNIMYKEEYKKKDKSHYHTTYDFGSIMHYLPYNGDAINKSKPVFELLDNITYKGKIGQRTCLSKKDVDATVLLFGCENNSVTASKKVCLEYTIITRRLVHYGDVVGLKSIGTAIRKKWWLKCNESNCAPSKCPGKNFSETDGCFSERFAILSAEGKEPGMLVSVGDIVVLSVVDNTTANETQVVNCTYTGSNSCCKLETVASPLLLSGDGSNLSFPLVQRFRLRVEGKEDGRWIKDKESIFLEDVNQTELYLRCKRSRRKGNACYLHPCISSSCDLSVYTFSVRLLF